MDKNKQKATASGIALALVIGISYTTVIAFAVQNIAQKYISFTSTALILTLESAFGGIFAIIYLKEVITLKMTLGCLAIFMGIVTEETNWQFIKKKQISTKETI